MDRKDKPATLYDVAAYCGVSYQTVSRVINGSPQVSAKTRHRVLEAVKILGYQPNKAARTLVTRRSSMLEVITYGSDYYGPSQMMYGVERAARQAGYRLTFASLEGIAPQEIAGVVENLGTRSVDGTVIIAPVEDPIFEQIEALYQGLPFLKIGTQVDPLTPSVAIDQAQGSRQATQHLIDLGHTCIAAIRGPEQWHDANARHTTWLATLRANGLEPGGFEIGNWSAQSGYEAAYRLCSAGIRFTALVVGNDQMALGAIRALRECGQRVPDDISVVGFDDIPEAAYFDPPLTTVRQDFAAMGQQAVAYLVQIINDPHTPAHQKLLFPKFIERSSTRAFERS
ncbi:MAG TPA: substrate-binding domain-containing protein [Aggregatilineales bacterium]|nr:substrate-binding domain-containing protein [Aggregatilineales bacterium]